MVLAVARGTLTVQLKLVCSDMKTVLTSHLVLKFLDVTILKLDDLSTCRADHVIMVSLVGHVVIVCLSSKMPLLCQSTLAKKIQRAVDRCEPDMRFMFCQLMVELLGGDMFHREKCLEDKLTLGGDPQFMGCKVLAKSGYLVLIGVFRRALWHYSTSLILIINLLIIPFG